MLTHRPVALDLEAVARRVALDGPCRVIVSAEAYAVGPERALRQFGIQPDVIFIRSDGWTLGAPAQWRDIAERIWDTDWVGVIENGTVRTYQKAPEAS